MKAVSDRIKEALDKRNMKQSELVKKTGIGKSSISTYISGAYEPKQKNISKIAKALDVNDYWLMGYDIPMERDKKYLLENGTEIFDLAEENFNSKPEIAEAIFKEVGEMIVDLSLFTGSKNARTIYLSEIFNNNEVTLKTKLSVLKSLIDIVKYDNVTDELTIYFNFVSQRDENEQVINDYEKLNETGKAEARKRIHELTYLDDYRKKEK